MTIKLVRLFVGAAVFVAITAFAQTSGAGTPVALLGQLLDLRPPRGHERVLARNEERVQQDQRRDAEELEEKGHVPAAAGVGLSGSSSKGLAGV